MSLVDAFQKADYVGLLIARYFEQERGPAVVSVGNNCSYDIQWKSGLMAEIKLDLCARRTGKCCVEFWNQKKNCPSGILSTKADLWLHCIPEGDNLRVFEIDTRKLLKLCLETGAVQNGGDFGASRFKLIALSDLVATSEREFTLNSDILKLIMSH